MATYAGYKAYETPDLGGIAAKAVDKLTEAQDKKDLLQQQLDYKKSLSVQKAAEKAAEKQEKETAATTKETDAAIKGVLKTASEFKIPGDQNIASAANQLGSNVKNAITPYIGANDPEKQAEAKKLTNQFTYSVNTAKGYFDELSKNIEKVKEKRSPYLTQLASDYLSIGAPSETNRVEYDIDPNGEMIMKLYKPTTTYQEPTESKERIGTVALGVDWTHYNYKKPEKKFQLYTVGNASSMASVLGEVGTNTTDFKKEEEDILKYGKSIENAAGNVVQASSKDFEKQRDAYAKRTSNGSNPRDTYDAVYHYIPIIGKEVIPVGGTASPEDIDKMIEAKGYKKEDVFVLRYSAVDGKLIPMLDEKQQKELEGAIKQSINGQVVKQVTKSNVETAEKKTKKEQEDFVSLILKGDPGALQSFGNIGTQRKQLGSEESKPAYRYENGILYVRGIINKLDDPTGKGTPIYGDKPIDPKSPGARQEIKEILGYK